jgi:uracil-DNA glycosylase family 4
MSDLVRIYEPIISRLGKYLSAKHYSSVDEIAHALRWMYNDHLPTKQPVMALLGEAPSDDEFQLGFPFVGPAGVVLEAGLEFSNFPRDNCFITNVFPFEKPDEYRWKVGDSDVVSSYIRDKLKDFPVITCLGKPAVRIYSDSQESIIDASGSCFEVNGQKIIPSIHPAYALKAFISDTGGDESVFWYLVLALRNAKGILNGEDVFESTTNHKAGLILDKNDMISWFGSVPDKAFVSLDYEATHTNPYLSSLPLCGGLSYDGVNSVSMAFNPWFPDSNISFSDFLKVVAECNHLQFIMHNLLYDYSLMYRFGYRGNPPAADTMYLAHLGFEFMPKNLKFLSSFFCKIKPYSFSFKNLEPFIRKGPELYEDYKYWLIRLLKYNGVDAIATRLLLDAIPRFLGLDWPRVQKLYNEYMHRLLLKLRKVQENGMILNLSVREEIHDQLKSEMSQSEHGFKSYMPGVDNLRSSDQVADAFKGILEDQYPSLIRKTEKGNLSLTAGVLKALAEQGIQPADQLLHYRKTCKLLSTYIDSYPEYLDSEGLIHTQFALTKTSRLRSSDPALQTLPRQSAVLQLFTADVGIPPYEHVLVKGDYSGAEARELAYFCGIQELLDPTVDIHVLTATIFFEISKEQVTPEKRQTTKNLTFGVIYGASAPRVAVLVFGSASRENISKARDLIEAYFKRFYQIPQFMRNRENDIARLGYVETPMGLRRHFPVECMIFQITLDEKRMVGALGRRFGNRMYSKAKREGYNCFPQTGVAYTTNVSLCNLDDAFEAKEWNDRPKPTVNLQIHDALISRMHQSVFIDAFEIKKNEMLRPIIGDLVIPVDFSIGWDLRNQVKIISAEESVQPIDWDKILGRLRDSKRTDLYDFALHAKSFKEV